MILREVDGKKRGIVELCIVGHVFVENVQQEQRHGLRIGAGGGTEALIGRFFVVNAHKLNAKVREVWKDESPSPPLAFGAAPDVQCRNVFCILYFCIMYFVFQISNILSKVD